jgi:hypothetical protein
METVIKNGAKRTIFYCELVLDSVAFLYHAALASFMVARAPFDNN